MVIEPLFSPSLPVHDRPVVGIQASLIGMRFADLIHELVFVDGDAETGIRGQGSMAVGDRCQGFSEQVCVFVVAALLDEKVGDGSGDLQTRGERTGTLGVVRGQRRVVGLGHAGDDLQFGDAAGIANIRLEDVGGALFENFLEPPLGKDALAGGNGDVGLFGELGHDVDVEGLHNFLVEPRMIRFERFDEQRWR